MCECAHACGALTMVLSINKKSALFEKYFCLLLANWSPGQPLSQLQDFQGQPEVNVLLHYSIQRNEGRD